MSAGAIFSTLPFSVRRRIDEAFDEVYESSNKDTANVQNDSGGGFLSTSGGGFIPAETSGGGGFIADSPPPRSKGESVVDAIPSTQQIPLSSVPIGLQLLDLPPDDEEVLSVFRKAASGWEGDEEDVEITERMVSKEDWRSVCAILLEEDDADENDETESEEGYSDTEEVDDEDEYVERPSNPSRRRTRHSTRKSPTKTVSALQQERAHQVSLEMFALFFPEASPDDLPRKRIMIRDIHRVAKLLGENIKADEMVEMVEMFSTNADQSMSLGDFEKMMEKAGLI